MPTLSDESFKEIVSELYGSEYKGSGVSLERKPKAAARNSEDQSAGSNAQSGGSDAQSGGSNSDDSSGEGDEFEPDLTVQGPDIQEIRLKNLSSLYEGMKSKEQILDAIEKKIIRPLFERKEPDGTYTLSEEDATTLENWWFSFKEKMMKEDVSRDSLHPDEAHRRQAEGVESMIARINSNALFDDILDNLERSKKEPEKKIKLRDLMDMLKN
jgi:hypothetical protein